MVAQISSSICQPKEIWAFCAHCSADSVPPGEEPSSPWLGCGGEDCAVHPVSLENPCQHAKAANSILCGSTLFGVGCRLSQLAILAILSIKEIICGRSANTHPPFSSSGSPVGAGKEAGAYGASRLGILSACHRKKRMYAFLKISSWF